MIKEMVATVSLSLIPVIAFSAGTSEVTATKIPAAACQPANDASSALVQLSSAWRFKPGQSGTAYLRCPLPLGNNRATTGAPQNYFDSYRVFHKDPDGTGINNGVTVELRAVSTVLNRSVLPIFNSNNSSITSPYYANNTLNNTEYLGVHDFYFFNVIMSGGVGTEFYGIDFQ